jgi:hypothetical protein
MIVRPFQCLHGNSTIELRRTSVAGRNPTTQTDIPRPVGLLSASMSAPTVGGREARARVGQSVTSKLNYLVAVLGEVPDQNAALRQLARVLRPGGPLVVGELLGDPHMVTERSLRRRAQDAGLRFERRVGPPFGYFAVLRREA